MVRSDLLNVLGNLPTVSSDLSIRKVEQSSYVAVQSSYGVGRIFLCC